MNYALLLSTALTALATPVTLVAQESPVVATHTHWQVIGSDDLSGFTAQTWVGVDAGVEPTSASARLSISYAPSETGDCEAGLTIALDETVRPVEWFEVFELVVIDGASYQLMPGDDRAELLVASELADVLASLAPNDTANVVTANWGDDPQSLTLSLYGFADSTADAQARCEDSALSNG